MGKKSVIPFYKIYPAVQDYRTAFLKVLDGRFDEKVGHEEDIFTTTALDPGRFLFYFLSVITATTNNNLVSFRLFFSISCRH